MVGALVTFVCAREFGLAGATFGYVVTAALSAVMAWAMVRKGDLINTMPIGDCLLFSVATLAAGAFPLIIGELPLGLTWLSPASALLRIPLYLALAVIVVVPLYRRNRGLVTGLLRGNK